MPHQCLKCGQIFEEGSSQLLKGCPDCGGNRFFYTKKPLNEAERDEISKEVSKDLPNRLKEMLLKEEKEGLEKTGRWVKIKPKEIRKMLEQEIQDSKPEPDTTKSSSVLSDDERNKLISQIKSEMKKSDKPETIDIIKPGKYNIDIQGLLDNEPIIIQKDGTYTIHLPSIFKMIEKPK